MLLYSWIQYKFKLTQILQCHSTWMHISVPSSAQSNSETLHFTKKEISHNPSQNMIQMGSSWHTALPLSVGRDQLLLMRCLVNWQFTCRIFEFKKKKLIVRLLEKNFKVFVNKRLYIPSHESFLLWLSLQLNFEGKLKGSGAFTLRVKQLSGVLWFSF